MSQRINRIALLTGPTEAPLLTQLLTAHNPELEVVPVHEAETLAGACRGTGTRLIAVCSSVIVPAAVLSGLDGPAYNFHPGPPTRPGRYPSVFALYHGDTRFGITAHEMAPQVDSGPIVAVEWFEMPPDAGLMALETLTLQRIVALFERLAPHLSREVAPLPHTDAAWSGTRTTRAQANVLSRITRDMSAEEIARRKRACGGQVTEEPGWIAT